MATTTPTYEPQDRVLVYGVPALVVEDDGSRIVRVQGAGHIFAAPRESIEPSGLPLAFYGTLRPEGSRRKWTEELGTYDRDVVRLRGDLYSVHGSFPALVPGDGIVIAQLFRPYEDSEQEAFRTFDSIEGYDRNPETSLYLRKLVETLDGEPCWTYIWNGPTYDLPRISSGDWMAR